MISKKRQFQTLSAQAAPVTMLGNNAAHHILVVDDEDLVLALTTRMLRNAGYGVLQATSARQALQILEQAKPPVDLVLTDVVMPETDGRALGLLIAERFRGIPVAYMSAYAVNDVFHRGSPDPNMPFLSKPFSEEALLAMLKTVLGSRRVQPPG